MIFLANPDVANGKNGKKGRSVGKDFPFHPLFPFFQRIFSIFMMRIDWCVYPGFITDSKRIKLLNNGIFRFSF